MSCSKHQERCNKAAGTEPGGRSIRNEARKAPGRAAKAPAQGEGGERERGAHRSRSRSQTLRGRTTWSPKAQECAQAEPPREERAARAARAEAGKEATPSAKLLRVRQEPTGRDKSGNGSTGPRPRPEAKRGGASEAQERGQRRDRAPVKGDEAAAGSRQGPGLRPQRRPGGVGPAWRARWRQ